MEHKPVAQADTHFKAIRSFLSKAYDQRHNDLIKGIAGCAKEEFLRIRAGARTMHDICNATGLNADQVSQIMKDAEGELSHHVVKKDEAHDAHKDLVLYGLREHRKGQAGWTPGITE